MILKEEYLIEIFKLLVPENRLLAERFSIRQAGGGNINNCYVLSNDNFKYFLKHNENAELLIKEKEGLEFLQSKSELILPKVNGFVKNENGGFLLLEHLEKLHETQYFFEELGRGLATLHLNSENQFGFQSSNYIGKLVQLNSFFDTWQEFFIVCRIEPIMRNLKDSKNLPPQTERALSAFCMRINEIFPNEKPSLLHGDLWSGNRMNCTEGAAIFDPAIYYGHREMDIGMSYLFGGFSPDFYEAYNRNFPLEKGWEKRISLTQIYPLLVHAQMFGGSYMNEVSKIMKPFL